MASVADLPGTFNCCSATPGLGSIAGVLIVDYWLVRNKRLALGDLYRTQGIYTYTRGWNWRAVVATIIGCALAWIGLVVPALRPLYDYAWFVGFGASAVTHLFLMKLFPPQASAPPKFSD